MTPPVRDPFAGKSSGGGGGGSGGKDFTPNLGPIDSQAPLSSSAWDSETDHILSFFLGGENALHSNPHIPDFASAVGQSYHGNHSASSSHGSYPTSLARGGGGSSGELKGLDDDDGGDVPPPTPAVNFYAPTPYGASSSDGTSAGGTIKHSTAQQPPPATTMTSSSSSSSLSSIAQALVTGGPLVYQQLHTYPQAAAAAAAHHHQQQHRTASPMDHISPISPAALIGHGENLMLPPPPPGGSAPPGTIPSIVNVASSVPTDGRGVSDHERHLAWLRDLNAIAKGAATVGAAPSQPNHLGQPKEPPKVLPPGHMGPPVPGRGSVYAPPQMHATVGPMPPNHHHPGLIYGALMGPNMHRPQKPAAETAEKRAKRLERNRESARKSRRRKKERLSALEDQVNKLHGEIEVERRIQINLMVGELRSCRANAQYNGETNVIFATGPCSEISRAVLDFQYTALKQLILPRYHKALLWFTLQQESFFFAAKEEYASRENKLVRPSSGKVSSKQIGDEMTNGVAGSSAKKRVTFEGSAADGDKDDKSPNLSPHANDGAKVWPLFCYELSFSVDQEDRFVAAYKKLQESSDLANSRTQVAAAVRTGDRLREAVESLSRRTAEREQTTLNGILSQPQVAAYQQWLASNRERCARMVEQRAVAENPPPPTIPVESSLDDICQRLNEVLQISNPEREA